MNINIGKATGYKHARHAQRMTQDSSIRNTAKADVALGMAALFGLLLPVIVIALIIEMF
jgi:type IV secretory pathway component VirB8